MVSDSTGAGREVKTVMSQDVSSTSNLIFSASVAPLLHVVDPIIVKAAGLYKPVLTINLSEGGAGGMWGGRLGG